MGLLGVGALEVLADRIPYADKKSEPSIILALMNNEPPSDTTTLPALISPFNYLLDKCWAIDPTERPSAEHCLQILNTEASSPPGIIDAERLFFASNPPKPSQYLDSVPANPPTYPIYRNTESTRSSQQAHPGPSNQHVHFSDFFAAEFDTWLKSHGIPPQSLLFCGKLVAIHRLFLWVGVLGGWRVVTEKKLWPAVGAKLQFLDVTDLSLFPAPEVADQLLKFYEKVLANFETHWNNLFRACDPSAMFPLPRHLRYLRPEIERFAYDMLRVLLPQPPHVEAENSQPSGSRLISSNFKDPKREGEDLTLKGIQHNLDIRLGKVEVGRERPVPVFPRPETLQQPVNAVESSNALPSSATFRSPPKITSRKRNLETYATVPEDDSNRSNQWKRARINYHEPADA